MPAVGRSPSTTDAAASAETTAGAGLRPDGIPEEIPIGTADANPVTSEAITRILEAAAERYATVEAFRATGVYIEAARASQSGKAVEKQFASRLEVVFRRPDRLKIKVSGEEMAAGFVADGKTVTLLWPNEKQFRTFPQPESLAAFVEDERAGEILSDQSNAIVYSVVGALLVSEDPLRWLHANVKTYVYDGVEEVRGRPAWRIKFLQTDPELVVINWVDMKTMLLSKVSIIHARNDDGEFVESYADAAYGRIRIAILEDFKTGPRVARDSDFRVRRLKKWKVRKDESPAVTAALEEVSPWERLVRAAAAKTGRTTTVSLSVQSGGEALRLARVVEFADKVNALAMVSDTDAMSPLLVAASAGKLTLLGSGGEVLRRVDVAGTPGLVALLSRPGQEKPLLAVADLYGNSVRAYELTGAPAWSYTHEGGRISSLLDARPDGESTPTLYVSFLGDTGLRRLGPDGEILFASRRVTGITSIAGGALPGYGWRLIASTGEGAGFFTPQGALAEKFPRWSEDLQVGLLAFDNSHSSAPILQVAGAGGEEYLLRRVRPDGSPVWTAPLAQAVEDAEPVGLTTASFRSGEQEKRYVVALLSDGRVIVVSGGGEVIWRGKVIFGGAASSGNLARTAGALLAADMNGDGRDEIYVGGEGSVVQLTMSNALR